MDFIGQQPRQIPIQQKIAIHPVRNKLLDALLTTLLTDIDQQGRRARPHTLDRWSLACPASPVHFETQPIDILQTCFIGASNVLDYAVKQNARVLLASTSGTVLLTPTFCLHTLIKSQQRSTATLKLHARMKAIEETSIASALGHVTMKGKELWKLWGTHTNSNMV
jgi:hypothetical protein